MVGHNYSKLPVGPLCKLSSFEMQPLICLECQDVGLRRRGGVHREQTGAPPRTSPLLPPKHHASPLKCCRLITRKACVVFWGRARAWLRIQPVAMVILPSASAFGIWPALLITHSVSFVFGLTPHSAPVPSPFLQTLFCCSPSTWAVLIFAPSLSLFSGSKLHLSSSKTPRKIKKKER